MEPMVGRLLLPSFGGGFHVWTTSLMFFQGALFLGYLWAHLAAPRVGRGHFVLLAAALVFLPPTVRVIGEARDMPDLLLALVIGFGVPFVALATTGVVAQAWLARSRLPERDAPYRLYATSNLGSLAALLAYALLIEPLVGLTVQRWVWAATYAAYLVTAAIAWRVTHAERASEVAAAVAPPARYDAPAPSASQIAYWLMLSACPSAFLMAVTNLVALDAGNVPLVWVVPLALYLLTFVMAFAEPSLVPDFVRRLWPHFAVVGIFFFSGGETGGSWWGAVLQVGVLFVVCLAAHAELYDQRPAPARLTTYYLVVSLGGWVGGAFVALGAPLLFSGLWEYPLALALLFVTLVVGRRRELMALAKTSGGYVAVTALFLLAVGWKLSSSVDPTAGRVHWVEVQRSFYGIYYVIDRPSPRPDIVSRDLVSGTTRHGRQLVDDELGQEPIGYYARGGPIGDVLTVTERPGRRTGVVGLGIGAIAAYMHEGETLRYYEIDPVVIDLAERRFTFLSECAATLETVAGDARLSLAREARQASEPPFDLLIIDAFAGDAIPTHLVTREAIELYLELIPEDGILALHVSNRFYDLAPVVSAAARDLELFAVTKRYLLPRDLLLEDPSIYVVMARRSELLDPLRERGFREEPPATRAWTDDHASALTALRVW